MPQNWAMNCLRGLAPSRYPLLGHEQIDAAIALFAATPAEAKLIGIAGVQ
jgi:hypothetical protein